MVGETPDPRKPGETPDPKQPARRRGLLALAVAVALLAGIAIWWFARERERERAEEVTVLEAHVSRILEHHLTAARLRGISAAFALRDGRVGTAVAGLADTDAERPMQASTRFLAGSLGKSFHAALALSLHLDGTLDLDAPIARWLGDEPWFDRLPNARDLTLRILLQHQSGLIDHLWTPEFFLKQLKTRITEDADTVLPPLELISIAFDREPRFPAGKGFAYGDTNYLLAGIAIERATGRDPFELIEERFLAPLELHGIVAADSRRIPALAVGHQLPVNPFLLPPKIVDANGALRFHPMVEGTAGGFATTPRDMVRWAKALFEGRALPRGALADLVERSVPATDGSRYGLGVYLYDTRLGEVWGHGGFFPGYRSSLRYLPGAKIAVCVQANRDVLVDVDAIALEIAERITDESAARTR